MWMSEGIEANRILKPIVDKKKPDLPDSDEWVDDEIIPA